MTVLEELEEFLRSGRRYERRWIGQGTRAIYVRIEADRLTIAAAEYDSFSKPSVRRFVDMCEAAHQINPFPTTFVETAEHQVAQLLWERDWQKADQPGCLQKHRNHGEVPW